ncbi:VOC family protein [Phenylobacterium sp.]|uniref:VOC family protein n=1 Tax=Phenylobacterium sp. TaxID=1871053 RepID=UPI00286AEF2C|nr:VOC family protein [Phenylobacterium sp.]
MSANRMPEITPGSMPRPKGGIVSYLQVSDAAAASAFYRRAFGALEVNRLLHPDGKRIIHCHLYLNEGSLMLNDAFPDQGMPLVAPAAFTLTLMVDDIDAWFKRAADAGCEVISPVATMFWGDRYAALKDPFGVNWAMNEGAA